MLEIQNIQKNFGKHTVLQSVSLEIAEGDVRALVGSSGSGKSTLLRILMGLEKSDQGSVRIRNQLMSESNHAQWATHFGYVPQEGGLFPHLTSEQNITLVARVRRWPITRIQTRLQELSETVAMQSALLKRYPKELSGGQRQRIALMRAAFLDPDVLLLDEPMGALDPIVRAELQTELLRIFKQLKKTVILVTHDLGEAAYLADQITLMHEGRLIQTGGLRDLLERPADPFVTRFFRAQRTYQDALREEGC